MPLVVSPMGGGGGGGGTVTGLTGIEPVEIRGTPTIAPVVIANSGLQFVWDPTGPANNGNIYTSLATIATKAAAFPGPKVVYVRLQQSDQTIPAGAYDFGEQCTFVGDPTDEAQPATLIFPTGVTFADLPNMQDIAFVSTSVNPIVSTASGVDRAYVMTGLASIDAQGAGDFFVDAGGNTISIYMYGESSLSNDGARALIADVAVIYAFDRALLSGNAFFGNLGTTVNRVSAAANISLVQTGGDPLSVQDFEQSFAVKYTPAIAGNWPVVPTHVNTALDELAAKSTTLTQTTFVYDPAGAAGGNVYTSLLLLATAAQAVIGPKTIFVRLRAADRTVPAGAYNFGYDPTFVGDINDSATGVALVWPTGTTLNDFPDELRDLTFRSTSAAPIVSITNAIDRVYRMTGFSAIDSAGAAPFVQDAGVTGTTLVLDDQSGLSNTSARAWTTAGSIFVNVYTFAFATDDAFFGTIDTELNRMSATVNVSLVQTGGAALVLNDESQAQAVRYTPGSAASWQPQPTYVNTALDQVSARLVQGGVTASRPATPIAYESYFDTDIGLPIWWTGATWVNAAGIPA